MIVRVQISYQHWNTVKKKNNSNFLSSERTGKIFLPDSEAEPKVCPREEEGSEMLPVRSWVGIVVIPMIARNFHTSL